MVALAIALLAVFGVLTFAVRVGIQVRRTGSTGLSRLGRDTPPAEWIGGSLFVIGTSAGAISPILVGAGALGRIDDLRHGWLEAVGVALAVGGIAGVFAAQMQMGASWRIGVDASERTELVSGGVFALVRNPVYTAMIAAWVGFALMIPTWFALAAIALVAIGLELQVRMVEEPHMVRSHGERYLSYAGRVGRFVPGVGRLG